MIKTQSSTPKSFTSFRKCSVSGFLLAQTDFCHLLKPHSLSLLLRVSLTLVCFSGMSKITSLHIPSHSTRSSLLLKNNHSFPASVSFNITLPSSMVFSTRHFLRNLEIDADKADLLYRGCQCTEKCLGSL